MLPPPMMPSYMQRRTLMMGMLAAGAGMAVALRPSPGSVPPGLIPFGAYDPAGDFADETDFTIEHVFLPWEDVAITSLFDADRYAMDRNRALLVTLEPWTWSRSERNTARALRDGIADGAYDATMRSICEVLAALNSPLTLRWGHEMDDDNGQFIWAGWRPDDYIAAYRRMMDIARDAVPGINLMWSPLGDAGMEDYYPGDDYVDLTGLSVFGLQAWDRANYNRDRSFAEISPVERAIMWIGVYEMQHCPDVPWRVVLNECIELAKDFGGTDGHKYVNAVLNGLAPELRSAEVQADRQSGRAK